MAPQRPTPSPSKKPRSSLKQATLAFKTTKRGAAASSKAKAKSKTRAKPTSRSNSETENEGVNDHEHVILMVSESEDDETPSTQKKTLDMQDNSGSYRNYFREVKEMMGGMAPLHAEGQTRIHQMLRVFDNTYDYGPCVGLTRLERWERAEALGLNPPIEVRNILLTEQGSTHQDLVHPVFYGQVL